MATPLEKRALREKGHVSYNPNQSFYLSVQWVLRNKQVAEEMLKDGLAVCARATARDTPCVPLYFFRISFDQREAVIADEAVKVIGDHPHYAKTYKSLELGTPLAANQSKLKASGIDVTPLEWPKETPMTPEKKAQLGFAPVTISLSEFYLDTRAFYEHADSADYLKAYSVVMEGHRSLKATTRCMGHPTSQVVETILEPYLQAEQIKDSMVGFAPGNNNQQQVQNPSLFLEFAFKTEDWRGVVQSLVDLCKSTVYGAAKMGDEVRVEMSFRLPSKEEATTLGEILSKLEVEGGQLFLFTTSDETASSNDRPCWLPSKIKYHTMKPLGEDPANASSYFASSSSNEEGNMVHVAGYTLHPKHLELVADANLVFEKLQ